MSDQQTRGERNNNPFNLEHGPAWLGLCATQTDLPYLQFMTPEQGITAGFKSLHNQPRLHNLKTVYGIITRYAPPSENDTAAYINAICTALGVGEDDVLNLNDNDTLFKFGKAVIIHENGRCIYDDSTLSGCVEAVLE